MPRVSLVSTLHDSIGWSIKPLKEQAKLLGGLYDRRVVVITKLTSPSVVDALESSGWVLTQPKSNIGVDYISDSRRRVLKDGLDGGADYMHLTDMDRLLHWAANYPTELGETVARIPECDFTIIGRTARAFQTHPRNQIETEVIANRVFSLIYGKDVDITAASRGVSREAAKIILKHSHGRFFDTDSEWPTIILCKLGLRIGYIEVDGLEWETRLKREEMTFPDGRRVDVKEYYEQNPESWIYRTMLALRIAKAALNTYGELNSGYRTDS